MTTDSGFVMAQSDNLPKIDAFMMSTYFSSNPDFVSVEIKGVKAARSERESYGDSAVGYVQVKREGDICTVKARITPEHNIRQKCYAVTLTCNEASETVLSVQCEDCAAHKGGCKHAIAFLAWLHRRSEDPPSTSVECYWKKSKLSSVGTSLKFIKAKDICNAPPKEPKISTQASEDFLTIVKNYSKKVGDTENQLMKYFKEPSDTEKLSIHRLVSSLQKKPENAEEFIGYCKLSMNINTCKEAESATKEQSNCPLWHELRYARITASKAYEAAHCHTMQGSLTESIMGASKLRDTDPIKRGRLLEDNVIKTVEKMKNIKITKSGLILNPLYPIMGASPDGECDAFSIEIKCPSSEKSYQLFCVAHSDFERSNNVCVIEVGYDKEFCEKIIDKCITFWSHAIFPLLFK